MWKASFRVATVPIPPISGSDDTHLVTAFISFGVFS
jgi:hypothetical protein